MRSAPPARRAVPVRLATSPFLRLASVVLRGVFGATARVRYIGPATLPHRGPLVLVANHTSNIDPPLVAAWLQPRLRRPIQFLAKEQLFVPALRPLLDHAGAILVRAGGRDVQAYRDALTVLRHGGVVGLFPEGTRSRDGVLGEPHPGVAMLAVRAGVPILPVGISGAQHYLPRAGRLPALGARITIHVGQPFRIDGGRAPDDGRRPQRARAQGSIDAATSEIMTRLAALLEPGQRGRWGAAGETGLGVPRAGADGGMDGRRPVGSSAPPHGQPPGS
jgi:1-acyl-sn-glycerol-3-phosphate acyltransferase